MSKDRNRDAAKPSAAALDTPTDLSANAVPEISSALNALLADTFALYLKTKNFHWHVSGPHFRDYHLLLDEQAEQIFAATDASPSGCARSAGRPCARSGRSPSCSASTTTMRSSSPPHEMLRELMNDNKAMAKHMREARDIADEHDDVATASCSRLSIDQAERRTWFLFEATRGEE